MKTRISWMTKSSAVAALLACLAVPMAFAQVGATAAEKVLYSFGNRPDAQFPLAALAVDREGNLYGTTSGGGEFGNGAIFQLTPTTSGWQETVLYSFAGNQDGGAPLGGLILDPKGNLYGTASEGGDLSCFVATIGCGVVFELSPNENGSWKYRVLYSFVAGNNDGDLPTGKLVFGPDGNLYGATLHGGGPDDAGIVFQLKRTGAGWRESAIHIFGVTGGAPLGDLVFDKAGNLYGTTELAQSLGSVFQLHPNGDGTWTETDLHIFSNSEGINPASGLTIDASGNLYGTTTRGGGPFCFGQFGCGTVFEVSPDGHGSWTESTLYVFTGGSKDGQSPQGVLLLDPSGNLLGTTAEGGGTGCDFSFGCGTAFELTPSSGIWKETVLRHFSPKIDGKQPQAGLVCDRGGHVYGTTSAGATNGVGAVFQIF